MPTTPENGFLKALPAESYARLMEQAKLVELGRSREIYRDGEAIEWVYFPLTALLSLISSDGGGQSVETSMAGNEGAAGLVETLGSGIASVNCVVQVDGEAWRAPAAHCRRLAASDHAFNSIAWRLAELQLVESRQSGLCQAMHSVEQRFARWLMESLDRSAGRNPLPMTQEFLAAMLGVQRTTVSTFAAQLQREGLIRYRRGALEIVNVPGLEHRACECHASMDRERLRLGLSVSPSRGDGRTAP